jgi:hypothetical protein
MGRRRQYESAAERQRACRQRQEAATVRVDRRALDRLHGRLEELQVVLGAAARRGDPIARHCGAASVETMLEKLIRHFGAATGAEAQRQPYSKQDS